MFHVYWMVSPTIYWGKSLSIDFWPSCTLMDIWWVVVDVFRVFSTLFHSNYYRDWRRRWMKDLLPTPTLSMSVKISIVLRDSSCMLCVLTTLSTLTVLILLARDWCGWRILIQHSSNGTLVSVNICPPGFVCQNLKEAETCTMLRLCKLLKTK